MWLIDDPLVWTTVLESDDADHRVIAKSQLEELLGYSVEFDLQADHQERAEQVRSLRGMLLRTR